MRKGGGKAKGSSFEREICRKLSMWLSNGVHEDVLWRSAMSGGRSTVSAKKGKRLAAQAGDISCIHPCGQPFISQFLVECKNYRDLQLEGMLTGKGALVNFWNETKKQAKQYEKYPMLVARQNMYPTFVGLDSNGLMLLNLWKHDIIVSKNIDLHIVLLDEFLRNASLLALEMASV